LPASARLHAARRRLLLDASSSHGEVVTAPHQLQASGRIDARDRIADGAAARKQRPLLVVPSRRLTGVIAPPALVRRGADSRPIARRASERFAARRRLPLQPAKRRSRRRCTGLGPVREPALAPASSRSSRSRMIPADTLPSVPDQQRPRRPHRLSHSRDAGLFAKTARFTRIGDAWLGRAVGVRRRFWERDRLPTRSLTVRLKRRT
jgi:hypothetical protein